MAFDVGRVIVNVAATLLTQSGAIDSLNVDKNVPDGLLAHNFRMQLRHKKSIPGHISRQALFHVG